MCKNVLCIFVRTLHTLYVYATDTHQCQIHNLTTQERVNEGDGNRTMQVT